MQLSTADIVNSVAEKLRKESFSEKDIEMAIQKAKQHYDAYLKSVKNPKPNRKEVDKDDEDSCFY
jgi:hypothetical protein